MGMPSLDGLQIIHRGQWLLADAKLRERGLDLSLRVERLRGRSAADVAAVFDGDREERPRHRRLDRIEHHAQDLRELHLDGFGMSARLPFLANSDDRAWR